MDGRDEPGHDGAQTSSVQLVVVPGHVRVSTPLCRSESKGQWLALKQRSGSA
jgi:hypothetical protein